MELFLVLNDREVVYSGKDGDITIPFSEDFQIKVIRKVDPSEPSNRSDKHSKKIYGSTFGYIVLKSSSDYPIEIKFGLVKNYMEIVEKLYLTFCIWKEKNKLFLSKNRILDFGAKKTRLRHYSSKEKLIPINLPEEFSSYIYKDLEHKEEVYIYVINRLIAINGNDFSL